MTQPAVTQPVVTRSVVTDGSRLRVRIVGRGRAGGSFASALAAAGCEVDDVIGRDPQAIATAAAGADIVLICVPDGSVGEVAEQISPDSNCVIAHVAGSLPLQVLGFSHTRVGSIHPLVSLPNAERGAAALRESAWFAVAGDPTMDRLVDLLGGMPFGIANEDRAAYHAAACIAANHLVALMGQVERIAASVNAPPEAFMALAAGALNNVVATGAAAALTGPAARGDEATIARHLQAIDPSEQVAYRALADQARRLASEGVFAWLKD